MLVISKFRAERTAILYNYDKFGVKYKKGIR